MKDLQEDNLFDSMRDRLGRFEEAPSEEVWEKIASQKKKDRVWPLFLESMGVVIIGIALMFNYDGMNDDVTMNGVTKDDVTTIKPQIFHRETAKGEIILIPQDVVDIDKKEAKQEIFKSEQPAIVLTGSQITNSKSEINYQKDSVEVISPIIKKDSLSASKETVPPFKKPKSKFQLYLSVTPSLSFQKMSPTGHDDIIVQGLVSRSPLSLKRFGFSVDAGFQRDINRYFGYYGGLSFYHQNQDLEYQYYNKEAEVTRVGDSFTYEIVRQEHTRTFNYSMTNLGVSAGMLVTLKGEKLKHKFGAGLIYTRSLNSSNSYLAYKLSYRNEVRVNDYISWYVEPSFVYSFISKEKIDEPFTLKPYRAGISLGVLYRFKK